MSGATILSNSPAPSRCTCRHQLSRIARCRGLVVLSSRFAVGIMQSRTACSNRFMLVSPPPVLAGPLPPAEGQLHTAIPGGDAETLPAGYRPLAASVSCARDRATPEAIDCPT